MSSVTLGPAALSELSRSSSDIVALIPAPQGDSPSSPFRGLVVGAVQSGKTSSMIGVSAVALDQGYKIVVVLAGGKDDLRQQTARRFNVQLFRQSDQIAGVEGARTLPAGSVQRPNGGVALPYSVDAHQWANGFLHVRDALRRQEPCLFVIKKNMASLLAMRNTLGRAYREFGPDKLPTLVLDDECDDASVDKADAPIPEAIANLWRNTGAVTAYVGYTATAAANLLQHPDNELYPEHFVYLLKYPAADDSALTVKEPNPDNWYSGSECFYEAFGDSPGPDSNFLLNPIARSNEVAGPIENNRSLLEALRSYLIAGAYRLVLQPEASFDIADRVPAPHSMLIQTSALVDEHKRVAEGLVRLYGVGGARALKLDSEKMLRDLAQNETAWQRWFDEFTSVRERLYEERPSPRAHRVAAWDEVRAALRTVLDNVRIKVVNSDVGMGEDLDYQPRLMADGTVRPPQDIYVIVIGGSKLSRGITIEGLCTSYFMRWVPNPTDDTVLQISRWFGYRGRHLEFCRLFTSLEIVEGLTEIHENDRDLRIELAEQMQKKQTPRQAGLVIQCNPRALPTGKLGIGKTFDVGFSPYQTVFATVESGRLGEVNERAALSFVQRLEAGVHERVLTEAGTRRGMLARGWTAIDVATALESLQYYDHNPATVGNPTKKFHKPPDASRPICSKLDFRVDPYQVAAYLREWGEMARKREAPPTPTFNVGFAFGATSQGTEPFAFPLLNRVITPGGKLLGGWTGASSGWRGDAFFDTPDLRLMIGNSALRTGALPGLLLLYVIHKDARGRQGEGVPRSAHTVTFGISIPAGGPRMRRVTVAPQ